MVAKLLEDANESDGTGTREEAITVSVAEGAEKGGTNETGKVNRGPQSTKEAQEGA